jgi:hypothetical protein
VITLFVLKYFSPILLSSFYDNFSVVCLPATSNVTYDELVLIDSCFSVDKFIVDSSISDKISNKIVFPIFFWGLVTFNCIRSLPS